MPKKHGWYKNKAGQTSILTNAPLFVQPLYVFDVNKIDVCWLL